MCTNLIYINAQGNGQCRVETSETIRDTGKVADCFPADIEEDTHQSFSLCISKADPHFSREEARDHDVLGRIWDAWKFSSTDPGHL